MSSTDNINRTRNILEMKRLFAKARQHKLKTVITKTVIKDNTHKIKNNEVCPDTVMRYDMTSVLFTHPGVVGSLSSEDLLESLGQAKQGKQHRLLVFHSPESKILHKSTDMTRLFSLDGSCDDSVRHNKSHVWMFDCQHVNLVMDGVLEGRHQLARVYRWTYTLECCRACRATMLGALHH